MSVATPLDAEFAAACPQPEPHRHLRVVGAPARGLTVSPPSRELSGPRAQVVVLHRPEPERLPVRLTRRGVVVVAALAVAIGAGLVWLAALSAPDAPAASSGTGPRPSAVTVESGDTLWSIANRVAPDRDPREVVSELQARNHLSGAALVPGQRLDVR